MTDALRTTGLTPPTLNKLLGYSPTSGLQIRRLWKGEPAVEMGHVWVAQIYDEKTKKAYLRGTGMSPQDAVDMLELLSIELLR